MIVAFAVPLASRLSLPPALTWLPVPLKASERSVAVLPLKKSVPAVLPVPSVTADEAGRAVALPSRSVPASILVPPENVFVPASVSVPEPTWATPIAPPITLLKCVP